MIVITNKIQEVQAPERRAWSRSPSKLRSLSGPRWPRSRWWVSRTGASSCANSANPASVMRVNTILRSLVSRQRDTSPRFSNRSKSLVISGSRVIMRLPISLHANPSGLPRRMRSTLYCVGEISAAFRTGSSLLANRSAVTASAIKTCSSRTPLRRVLVADLMPLLTIQ